ncbi:DUF2490 domain-containing protein [Candidatus Sulfidibacterium hydrothermale]|uniref:DUF2490 domain-containing protein n=1 Tax=Candidatus Sulfidibacterium hydrothermale TaxID=2875962 RepID=UPI001F0A8B18|nr:DUF2490 domain-containing protein [Candidatus Sulfidibacterium hydrothermale]UBM62561.1 DUF2490 domain-containing protein [Candidatus Sulfidibacterium hydrothermale]
MNTSIQVRFRYTIFFLAVLLLFPAGTLTAQDSPNWDNQVYLGNKVTFGQHKWKYSLELQTRLRNNFQQLDNWFIEFVSNYLVSKKFELVPDFRFTVKPDKTEYRIGLGVLYKRTTPKIQFVNQVKWQLDVDNHGKVGNAMREVIFLNYPVKEKIVTTLVAGFIYRWWSYWNGFQYIRVGPGITYRIDAKHTLNFSYFVGVENNTKDWLWAGIPMVQLVINVSKKYKYTPAYYFDF